MAVSVTTVPGDVRSVREPDERAFNRFFLDHLRGLILFAYRITQQVEVSEEIAADAMLKLWERWKGFSHPLAMKSFVYTAVRFAALNFVRDNRRELRARRRYGLSCDQQQHPAFHELVSREVCSEALAAVRVLPFRCRHIVEFLFIAGKTPAETAERMKLTVSTVRNQKARGLAILRRRMELSGNFPVQPDYIFQELY